MERKGKRLTRGDLCRLFPNAFSTPKRPLKIGIHHDLLKELAPAGARINNILGLVADWVALPGYVEAIAQGGCRYDLSGEPCGLVSDEQKLRAQKQIQRVEAERQAYGARAMLLKEFESSGLTQKEFALLRGITLDELNSLLSKATHDRGKRHEERQKLVAAYRASGLTLDEFVKRKNVSSIVLRKALRKLGMPVIPTLEAVQALDGKNFAMLSTDEQHVLRFYLNQGRKFDVAVEICGDADPDQVERASHEQADEIMRRANSHVRVNVGEGAQQAWAERSR